MNILFTHAYYLRMDPKQWATQQPYPPLGTMYAAAIARQHGFNVAFHDSMFNHACEEIRSSIKKYNADCLVICEDGFNYVTKMCLLNMREAAFCMMAIARELNCKVIISSSDATDHVDEYLGKGADFVILGEVEYTLIDLLSSLSTTSQQDFSGINGLAFATSEGVIKTSSRKVSTALDQLPLPAWDLIDISPYRNMWMKSSGYFSLNVVTTRGCPYKCNWCAKPIYGNRYNVRSPESVVDEITMLKQQFNMDHIWFCDDIFGLKPGWIEQFSKLICDRNLHFRFKIQARADLLVNENYVKCLAEAGCDNAWIGAESGSQHILDAMDKGIKITQVETATRLLKKYGIKPSFFLQFGYPGETRNDINKTIHMVNRLLPHSIGISVSYPLPGTSFYESVKADLGRKANWTDSHDLALMFRNTYQPEFYKHLHKYVHINHRMHQAIQHIRTLFRFPFKTKIKSLKKIVLLIYYFPAIIIAKYKLEQLAKHENDGFKLHPQF